MPPIDLPRGNAAKPAPPRPASAYKNPPPAAPTVQRTSSPPTRGLAERIAARITPANALPHGRGVVSTVRAAPSRPASAYKNLASRVAPARSAVPSAATEAAITRYAAANPFEPIAVNGPATSGAIRQMMARAQFGQDYQTMRKLGLLPSDAQQPTLAFPSRGLGPGGELSYEVGAGGRGTVNLSPQTVFAATDPQSPLYSWGMSTLIHELAHALQRPSVQQNAVTREGGAQAYADAAVPAALGPLQTSDTNYSGYVQQVRRRGPAWYMRQQFGR